MPVADDGFDYNVSRKVGKAATLKAAPAYTFGNKHASPCNDPGPGPGTYEPSSQLMSKGGAFGSSTRDGARQPANPAPGDYGGAWDADLKRQPKYSFRTKSVPDHFKSKTPGPGTYDPSHGADQVRPGVSAYTIGSRPHDHKSSGPQPGPTEYNPDFRVKEQPGISLKFRHDKSINQFTSSPGPGEYPLHNTSPPGKTFGTSRSDNHRNNGVPGPIYNAEPVRARRASWTIGRSSRDARLGNEVPGPGMYGAHAPVVDRPQGHGIKSDNRSAPAFSIPARAFESRQAAIPGPQDYNLGRPDIVRRSAPAFTLHGANTKDSRRNYPGPGHYHAEDAFKASSLNPGAPAISIAQRPEDFKSRENRPGPGEYAADYRWKSTIYPTLKFRHEPHSALQNATPAPHDYSDKDFIGIYSPAVKGKGISFGIRHKVYGKEDVPGPIYAVGVSTLGIAAEHELPKSKVPLKVVL